MGRFVGAPWLGLRLFFHTGSGGKVKGDEDHLMVVVNTKKIKFLPTINTVQNNIVDFDQSSLCI